MKQQDIIEKNELFYGITGADLERMLLCSKSRLKHYRQGEVLFSQEDKPCYLFALLKGRVALVRNLISGRKNIFYEVEEGSVFGEHYFFSGDQSYWYGAEACTKTEILEIPLEFFYCFCDEACEHHKQLTRNMLTILSKKEWTTLQKLQIVSPTSLKERISIWLLEEADDKGVVKLKMNRESLANYLGVARPSLSRTLMKLQTEGLLEVGKEEIRILKMDELEKFYF